MTFGLHVSHNWSWLHRLCAEEKLVTKMSLSAMEAVLDVKLEYPYVASKQVVYTQTVRQDSPNAFDRLCVYWCCLPVRHTE